jgi:hypothetical protein
MKEMDDYKQKIEAAFLTRCSSEAAYEWLYEHRYRDDEDVLDNRKRVRNRTPKNRNKSPETSLMSSQKESFEGGQQWGFYLGSSWG